MKRKLNYIYFIILFLTSIEVFATDWYVQPATGEYGSENGTSWDNAFDGFADIAWGSISAGDNIYLSDGTYNETMTIGASGAWNNYINILAGKYSPSPAGHDGEVIIDHDYAGSEHGINILGATCWIKIKGITIRQTGSSGIYMYANATTANPYRIWVDSCEIYDVGDDECMEMLGYFSGTPTNTNMGMMDTTHHIHHVEISRCYMYTPSNRAMGECNVIYGHLTGNLNIHHNTLHQRNLQEGATTHIDPIQLSYSNYSVKIYNNILMTDSAVTGHTMILGLMARGSDYNDTCIVYNNYVYNGGATCATNWKQEILWRAPEGELPNVQKKALVYSVNNTIVARNGCCWNSCAEGEYNPRESNNMFVHFGENGAEPDMDGNSNWYSTYGTGDYKQADSNKTNLFYQSWGGTSFGGNHWRGNGGSPTGVPDDWADFVSADWGGSGVNDDPEFVNDTRIPTGDPYEISSTSPAINAGTNMTYILQAFEYLPLFDASTDILGNERDSQWDIGCFEYEDGSWTPPDTTAIVTFTEVTNAVRNGYYIASGVLSGADSTFHIYTATADSFKVGALGTYDLTVQEAESGDTVFISNIASGSYSTLTTSSIIVSGTTRSFNVTTLAEPAPPDTVPNAFTFIDITNATRSTPYTSNGVTLSGFDSAYAYASGSVYTINGGGDLTGYTRVYPTNILRLKVTSSGSYSTAVNSTLSVGGVSDTYSVTTLAEPVAPDTIPNAFTFTDITGATRSTLYTSNLVTFTGFDSAYAYANGNEYQINSGTWVTGYTKVFNNDNARVRLTSNANYSTATSRTLTVGTRSDTYTVTTESAPVIIPKKYAPVRLSDGTILHNNLGMIGVLE